MNNIYEIVDASNDENYYSIGLFDSLETAIEFIKSRLQDDCAFCDNRDEDEIIGIKERPLNKFDEGYNTVYTMHREEIYIEETDEYKWIITKEENKNEQ